MRAAVTNEKSSTSDEENHGICSPIRCPRNRDQRAVEGLFDPSGVANLLQQFVDENRSITVSRDRTGGGRVQHDRAPRRNNGGKPAGDGPEAALERVSSRSIENRDFDGGPSFVHFAQKQIEAVPVTPHVGLVPNLRIHRNEVGLPVGLDAVAAEKKQCGRAGLDLAIEAIEGCTHGLFGEVLSNIDLESTSLQFSGQRPHVVDRIPQGCFGVGIGGVANDQRQPSVVLLRFDRTSPDRRNHDQKQAKYGTRTDAGHLSVSSANTDVRARAPLDAGNLQQKLCRVARKVRIIELLRIWPKSLYRYGHPLIVAGVDNLYAAVFACQRIF